jgi:hypothetical protein
MGNRGNRGRVREVVTRVTKPEHRGRLALAALTAALVAAGCGERKLPSEPVFVPTPNPSATLARVQAVVFTPNCAVAGCHSALAPQQGMSLAAGAAYGSIVRVPSVEFPGLSRVEPGSPDRSYLVKKLRGDPGITGVRMPDGSTLTPDEIQLVIDWVTRGAPNN